MEEKMKEEREPHKLIGWHFRFRDIASLLKAYISTLEVYTPPLNPSWTGLLALRFMIHDLPFMESL
jgi:hypothetical protein